MGHPKRSKEEKEIYTKSLHRCFTIRYSLLILKINKANFTFIGYRKFL